MSVPGTDRYDVAVVGGGMAGLTAALAAAETGASVAVIEADSVAGGSARWSSGRIWSLPDYPAFRERVPLGDPILQEAHAESFPQSLEWLASRVGNLAPQPAGKAGTGRSMTLGDIGDRSAYFAAFAAVCQAKGVFFFYNASFCSVERGTGFVVSYILSGRRVALIATAVVLASGGYQGDREMLARHLGSEADLLMVRSNPNSKGAGLRAGLQCGGALSRGMSGFYGKSMPPGAETLAPGDYKTFTYDIASQTIAVNAEGRRFVDEAAGLSGEAIPNASIYQPDGGRYFLILDGTQTERVDEEGLATLARRTGRELSDAMIRADRIDQLVSQMSTVWNIDRDGLLRTLGDVERAVAAGHGQSMSPPRRQVPVSLTRAPFIALACRAAITIPFGGLAVDRAMGLATSKNERLAGLFAAGADAGGAYVGAYAGGLAWALTSGRAAGLSAAGYTQRSDASARDAASMATA